ncbi:MAG TPA: polysaccharide deacetylase family protein [Candidatus Sumerlaeota bacterium]|nr:polysaccharide deacetylase family protein [Candidatus Sumerlaeota bacterium]
MKSPLSKWLGLVLLLAAGIAVGYLLGARTPDNAFAGDALARAEPAASAPATLPTDPAPSASLSDRAPVEVAAAEPLSGDETPTAEAATSPAGEPAAAPGVELSAAIKAHAGEKISRGSSSTRKIVLTFDDGPHPSRTPQVVRILKEAGIPANFFLVGEMVESYPEQAKLVADSGFELGTHSWDHPNLTRKNEAEVRRQIVETQDLVERTTGIRPVLFRPPGGNVDQTVRDICREENLVICMWSIDPRDWASGATGEKIRQKVVGDAHGGAIVCMHDTKAPTIDALPGMIADLKAAGYEFTTITQLLEEKAAEDAALAASGGVIPSGGDAAPQAEPLVISLEESGSY